MADTIFRTNGQEIIGNSAYAIIQTRLNENRIIKNNVSNTKMKNYILNFKKNNSNNDNKRKRFIEIVFNVHRYIKTRDTQGSTVRKRIIENLSNSILELAIYLAENNTAALDATLQKIFGKKNNGSVTEIKERTFLRALEIIKAPTNRKNGLTNIGNNMLNVKKTVKENNNKTPKLSRYNVILGLLESIVDLAKGKTRTPSTESISTQTQPEQTNASTGTQPPSIMNSSAGTSNSLNRLNQILEKILNGHRELSNNVNLTRLNQ